MNKLGVKSYPGLSGARFVDDLAALRIEVFREYPYLYDGDLGYERQYLGDFCQRSGATLVVATDGEEVVGVATAMPLLVAPKAFQKPFREAGLAVEEFFYLGESVLRQRYRGKGIGRRFFAERHRAAELQGFERSCFCAVERAPEDPRRPSDYRPLDGFWQSEGYRRDDTLSCRLSWKTIDSADEEVNRLTFWTRNWPGE